jgi:hypothetical protein
MTTPEHVKAVIAKYEKKLASCRADILNLPALGMPQSASAAAFRFETEALIAEYETILAALRAMQSAGEHVAWLRFVSHHNGRTTIKVCDSDDDGAFKVYRHAAPPQPQVADKVLPSLLRDAVHASAQTVPSDDWIERLANQYGRRRMAALRGDASLVECAVHWMEILAKDHWGEIVSALRQARQIEAAQKEFASAPQTNGE